MLHLAPESLVGGPLAFVKTGDEIELNVPKHNINLPARDIATTKGCATGIRRFANAYGKPIVL